MDYINYNVREVFKCNLRHIMKSKKIVQREIAEGLKVPPSTVNNWASGTKYPRPDIIAELAQFLDVEMFELLEPSDIQEIIKNGLQESQIEEIEVKRITGMNFHTVNKLPYSNAVISSNDVFAFYMNNDTMQPHIYEHDVLIVNTTKVAIKMGDIILCRKDGVYYVRQVTMQEDRIVLFAINQKYNSIVLETLDIKEEIEVIGKIIELRRNFKD